MSTNFLRINDPSIDWESQDSHFFFNTRHPQSEEWQRLAKALPFFPGHIYLFTSSWKKIVILSKESFLVSAQVVNSHLECTEKDRWLVSLPLTHVGGLSILARSFSGSFSSIKGLNVWNPKTFLNLLKEEKITLCSLVPTQIYDLVQQKFSPPKSLRAVLVGGGALSPSLYTEARKLNWPLLPSYGLTELCSQVATTPLSSLDRSSSDFKISKITEDDCSISSQEIESPLSSLFLRSCGSVPRTLPLLRKRESPQIKSKASKQISTEDFLMPELKILPHIHLKVKKGTFHAQSKALLKGYFDLETKEFWDPKSSEGWFNTGDLGEIKGKNIKVKGRKENQIKILGELTDLTELSHKLESVKSDFSLTEKFALIPISDQRKGWDLQIVTTSFDEEGILKVVGEFNKNVAPFQKVKTVYSVSKFPKTDIFKLSTEQIKQHIGLK